MIEVVPAGVEDVFDIQVDRTENFIANGLVSHNTRWHEDDFAGRLLSKEREGDPSDWTVIRLPAIAEDNDPLGRAEGEPLCSPLLDETPVQALERLAKVKTSVGTYTWNAMYQQRPSPAKGSIFDIGWWRYWTNDPAKATADERVVYLDPTALLGGRWLDSWDCAFKDKESSDWVVGQRWVRLGPNRFLVDQVRDRLSFTRTLDKMRTWTSRHVHQRLIEESANGPAILDVLRREVSGLKPVKPKTSKEARARSVTPECESGHVYLPFPSDPGCEWVNDLLSELRNFPNDAHDDQVDALTQALTELRDVKGGVTVPGRGHEVVRTTRVESLRKQG